MEQPYIYTWKPDKTRLTRPMYLSLSRMIEEDIINGKLKGGEKLPPQRELAYYLDINLSTVTRAYKDCMNKNLIYGVEGSGTFVSPQAVKPETNSMDTYKIHSHYGTSNKIIMGFVSAFDEVNELAVDTINNLPLDSLPKLLGYEHPTGFPAHKVVAKTWMSQFGIQADANDIIITSGTMNAISICLMTLFRPGDKIAVDYYIYFNFIQLAQNLNLQLIPIENDDFGMIPEQLENSCINNHIQGIMLMPSCSNPTATFMPISRKYELSSIIEKNNLIVLEDEYFAFASVNMKDYGVPIRELLPERTIYFSTTSYAICSGLRVSFMVVPHAYLNTLTAVFCNSNVKASSLTTEIVCQLIQNGTAEKIAFQKLELAKKANAIFANYFPNDVKGHPYSFFRWLKIPDHLQDDSTVGWKLLSRGIHSFYSRRFVCGKEKKEKYIRISLSSTQSLEQLEEGLSIIYQFFNE
ncbi:MAG: PLP-dependent aminotransferase family protein [Traorella sp.]